MPNYYLQDSGLVYWQLGVDSLERLTTTVVGPHTIVRLVVQDPNLVYREFGVEAITGRITTTVVGATTTTQILLVDAALKVWLLGSDIFGQPQLSFQYINPPEVIVDGGIYSNY